MSQVQGCCPRTIHVGLKIVPNLGVVTGGAMDKAVIAEGVCWQSEKLGDLEDLAMQMSDTR